MIRRLAVAGPSPWPSAAPGDPIRLLAVSDERDPAFDHQRNRDQLGRVDGILACGDLEPDYLAFLADAFHAPLVLVRGNHDRGGAWEAGHRQVPAPLDRRIEVVAGMGVLGLSWPGPHRGRAIRTDLGAWAQAIGAWLRASLARQRPTVVISHVPPLGHGDVASDPYHLGFAAYRWLGRRLRPLLWLHGHTPVAAVSRWRSNFGPTTLVNVTGAVLIELRREPANIPLGDSAEQPDHISEGAVG